MGQRGDVLRLQVQGLRAGRQPAPPPRAAGALAPRHGAGLVMALASSWRWPCIGPCPRACGTPRIGLCPPKKSLNAKAEQGGPRPNLPLQARPAPHPTSPSAPDPAPAPLERLAELMDGKGCSVRLLERAHLSGLY